MTMPYFYFGDAGLIDIFKPEARQWFWQQYKQEKERGIAGWWGDLGEPEVHPDDMVHVNGLGREVHGVYGHEWVAMLYENYAKDYPDERLFKLGRWVCRIATLWTHALVWRCSPRLVWFQGSEQCHAWDEFVWFALYAFRCRWICHAPTRFYTLYALVAICCIHTYFQASWRSWCTTRTNILSPKVQDIVKNQFSCAMPCCPITTPLPGKQNRQGHLWRNQCF